VIPPPFRYLKPASVAEALSLLASTDGAAVLAGGQSLINALKLDLVAPEALVDVHRLPELRAIEVVDGALRIGAAVTYAELATDPLVGEHLPALAAVAGGLVDRQVRNRGTIGGNVCLNDPTNNLPPLLASLDATFEVQEHGKPARTVPAAEFFLGTLLTVAHGPALLTAVTVPVQAPGTRIAYRHQQVGADSWALARAVVRVDVEGDTVVRARVHLGAVPDAPRRLAGVEAALEGAVLSTGTVSAALGAFDAEQVETLGDSHGSAAYRLAMTRVQLKRALQEISIPTSAAEEAVA
jgi:carbon-monoxide dehydrogenase medium subunit